MSNSNKNDNASLNGRYPEPSGETCQTEKCPPTDAAPASLQPGEEPCGDESGSLNLPSAELVG